MSAQTHTEAHTMQPAPDRMARLPLRAELFLLAHNDDTGEPHLNEQSLAVGLAAAILLELCLSRQVTIGWAIDTLTQRWQPHPGMITIIDGRPAGDPLSDAALATVRHTRHMAHTQNQLRLWMRTFAGNDLYERVRANMVTVGVLHRASRRRALGLVKTDTYLAVHNSWSVRARGLIRGVMHGYQHPDRPGRELPDEQCVALCGLVNVLELAPFLYQPGMSDHQLRKTLRHIVHHHQQVTNDPTISGVITALDAGCGDLAVVAMQ